MGMVEPTNLAVKAFKGLHLYHYGISNCSMRVRLTLEEKGLPWESHYVDLFKQENLTPEFFGINPNGLVPTLVDDGVVIIESNDIVDYLDKKFPEPPLRPSDEAELAQMYRWMERSTNIHVKAVKTYMYEKSVGGKMKKSNEEQKAYRDLQKNEELREFHAKASGDGFTREELQAARDTLDDCFGEAERTLATQPWLAGSSFSLADIAWIPLEVTLKVLSGYDFTPYPNICKWSDRIAERPSYKRAVLDWMPATEQVE